LSVLYAATGDAIARITLEGGAAASAVVGLEGSGACCLAVDPLEPERVYVGTFDRGVRVSDDGGVSWRIVARYAKTPNHLRGLSVLR